VMKEVRLHGLRYLTGATLSPLVAFLILRGLKTLELRIHRHAASAATIAKYLAGRSEVSNVYYPALATGEAGEIYKRQMSGGGGLVGFELKAGLETSRRFMNALQLVHRAVSLGDAETLIQHPATMTHSTYGAEERARHGITDGLIRLSVGLENVEDILDDFEQAFEK
jgi:methionine-gamma-lyase